MNDTWYDVRRPYYVPPPPTDLHLVESTKNQYHCPIKVSDVGTMAPSMMLNRSNNSGRTQSVALSKSTTLPSLGN